MQPPSLNKQNIQNQVILKQPNKHHKAKKIQIIHTQLGKPNNQTQKKQIDTVKPIKHQNTQNNQLT